MKNFFAFFYAVHLMQGEGVRKSSLFLGHISSFETIG